MGKIKFRIIKKSRYWVQERMWLVFWVTHENDGFNSEEAAIDYVVKIAKNIYDAKDEKKFSVCREIDVVDGKIKEFSR